VVGLDRAALRAALEAILLVVDEPVAEPVLAETVATSPERVADALAELSAEYTCAGRGFDLRRAAGGWRLYTRAEQAPYVQRFVLDGQQARLTQAALETLAVVAYQQPVTRSRVAAVRGVNCDGVIRTLLTRGLLEDAGTEPETGAHLYRTTSVFLEKLGLDSVDELPPLAPFLPHDLAGLDPDALDQRDNDRDRPAGPAVANWPAEPAVADPQPAESSPAEPESAGGAVSPDATV
jgi:segregation and condensation protein B